jgi:anti-sigma-K factor RskA
MSTKDDDVLAAEYALGLLDGEACTRFERRVGDEAQLRPLVRFWEDRLSTTLVSVERLAPPAGVIERVEGTLFGRESRRAPVSGGFPWKRFAVALVVVKLALLSGWYLSETTRATPEVRPAEVPGSGPGR